MDQVGRLKFGALSLIGFFVLLWIGVIAFAVVEALANQAYGWLVLVPVALWGLRMQITGARKISQAGPDDPRWLRSNADP